MNGKYWIMLMWMILKFHMLYMDDIRITPGEPFTSMHYDNVIMTMLASQITSLMVVYSIVYSGVNQRKHQSSASLAFVREIHRGPVNFPHKWPVTRKMFPFDDVIMGLTAIITIVRHKKPSSTAKVRRKNARFDTKMPSPACISWHSNHQTSTSPSREKYFFPILFQYFVFKNP